MRGLHQNARAVAGAGSAPTAPRCSRLTGCRRVLDDLVRLPALDVGDEADTAGIFLERRIEQAEIRGAHGRLALPARHPDRSVSGFRHNAPCAGSRLPAPRASHCILKATFVPPRGPGCFVRHRLTRPRHGGPPWRLPRPPCRAARRRPNWDSNAVLCQHRKFRAQAQERRLGPCNNELDFGSVCRFGKPSAQRKHLPRGSVFKNPSSDKQHSHKNSTTVTLAF